MEHDVSLFLAFNVTQETMPFWLWFSFLHYVTRFFSLQNLSIFSSSLMFWSVIIMSSVWINVSLLLHGIYKVFSGYCLIVSLKISSSTVFYYDVCPPGHFLGCHFQLVLHFKISPITFNFQDSLFILWLAMCLWQVIICHYVIII